MRRLRDMFFTPTKEKLHDDNVGELKEKVLVESWTVKYPTYDSIRYDLETPSVKWEHRVFTEKDAADKYVAKVKEAMKFVAPVLTRYVELEKNKAETFV